MTDRKILQENSLFGYEPKSLPYLLCQMNLLLHGLDAPKIDSGNALRFKLSEIGEKDRFEVILTNPPLGGEEEKGVQGNFPEDKQTRGSAAVSPTNHAASSSTADAGGTPRPSRCCCPERDSATCIRWWGHPGQTGERIETDQAWRVSASELLINNCNLDRKNPRAKEDITHLPPEQLLESIWQKEQRIAEIIGKIKPPPLQEERRAVARIEELAGKIGSAQAFRKAAVVHWAPTARKIVVRLHVAVRAVDPDEPWINVPASMDLDVRRNDIQDGHSKTVTRKELISSLLIQHDVRGTLPDVNEGFCVVGRIQA